VPDYGTGFVRFKIWHGTGVAGIGPAPWKGGIPQVPADAAGGSSRGTGFAAIQLLKKKNIISFFSGMARGLLRFKILYIVTHMT